MTTPKTFLNYAITITILLLIGGLAGWYYFLNKQKQDIAERDAGRGLGSPPPSFGGDVGSTYSNVSGVAGGAAGKEGKAPPRLWHVTKTPVAGMGFVNTEKKTAGSSATLSPQLYFAERGTGYILRADTATSILTRLTNKLFPKTYEALFDSNGSVILRSVDDAGRITSFAGVSGQGASSTPASEKRASDSAEAASSLFGKYLDSDIRAVAVTPDTRELLLLAPDGSGGSHVVLSSWDGKKQKTIFTSPLSGWKPFALSDGKVFLSLLPSDNAAGYAFEVKSGVLIPRLRNVSGLGFLPRSSDAVLFSQSSGGDVSLFSSPKKDSAPILLPLKTVADKCVWAPTPLAKGKKVPVGEQGPLIAYCAVPDYFATKTFLTDWYTGALHASDTWWRIDTISGEVSPLLESGDSDEKFDVENPIIDDAGEQIAFMDAKDKSLWLLRIQK